MNETIRHIEAFDYYYSLGGTPTVSNCTRVAEKFHISQRTFWNWYKKFNWSNRIEQRNIELANKLERKTNKIILNTKADYRKEIKQNLQVIKALIANSIEEIKAKLIKAESVTDINSIVNMYDKMVHLDLNLIGEGDFDKNKTIKIVLPDELKVGKK